MKKVLYLTTPFLLWHKVQREKICNIRNFVIFRKINSIFSKNQIKEIQNFTNEYKKQLKKAYDFLSYRNIDINKIHDTIIS